MSVWRRLIYRHVAPGIISADLLSTSKCKYGKEKEGLQGEKFMVV